MVKYEILRTKSLPSYISKLKYLLNSNEEYLKIFSIIEEEVKHRNEEVKKLNHTYNEKYKKCREIFKVLAKRHYLDDILSKKSFISCMCENNAYRKQLSEITSKTKEARDNYRKSMKLISDYMNRFMRLEEHDNFPSEVDIYEVCLKFSEFVVNCNGYKQIKSDYDVMISSIVNKYLTSSDFVEDFKKG